MHGIEEIEAKPLERIAALALESYGLGGARLVLFGRGEPMFLIELPADQSDLSHPYLGLLSKQTLALRVQADHEDATALYSHVQTLLEWSLWGHGPVCEPVPSCNGSLVIEVTMDGATEPRKCALLRWTEAEFFMLELGAGRPLTETQERVAHKG